MIQKITYRELRAYGFYFWHHKGSCGLTIDFYKWCIELSFNFNHFKKGN